MADGKNRVDGNVQREYTHFESVPLYLTTKYTFKTEGDIKPFVKADLGVAINRDVRQDGKDYDLKNGMYWGVGAGVEQNNIGVDLMFKGTTSEINGRDLDVYRAVLSVGYKFEI